MPEIRLGQVMCNVNAFVDPCSPPDARYLAGEHLDEEELRVIRWGTTSDDNFPPTFKRWFTSQQTLFHSRNPRKVAVPGFAGVTGEKLFILEPVDPAVLYPGLVPYVLQSQRFRRYLAGALRGSVNKYLNWKQFADFAFDLPAFDAQVRAASLLRHVDETRWSHQDALDALLTVRSAYVEETLSNPELASRECALDDVVDQRRPVCYGILKPGPHVPDGVPVIAVKDYPKGDVLVDELQRTTQKLDQEFARSRLSPGDVLLSIRGTVGRVATVPPELREANISRDTARIALKPEVNSAFVRALLESSVVQRQIRVRTVGLAVQGINIRDIRRLRILLPETRHQHRLLEGLSGLDQLKESLEDELVALRDLRQGVFREVLPELTHNVH